jgi:hypothetical protein
MHSIVRQLKGVMQNQFLFDVVIHSVWNHDCHAFVNENTMKYVILLSISVIGIYSFRYKVALIPLFSRLRTVKARVHIFQ